MGLVETEGIILKSYSLAEADKIVVLLTRRQGIVKGVAKGAKKLRSKFGGSLEPLTAVQIQYFQKEERELVSISQIDLVESHFEKTSDPLFLQKFSYLTEILIEFLPLNDPNENLYRMVKVCLETASTEIAALESIILYFEIWLLKLSGYLPNWEFCHQCRRRPDAHEPANLAMTFQLMCRVCRKTTGGTIVSGKQRDIFNLAQTATPERFTKATAGLTKDVKEVSAILKKLISNILGKGMIGEKVLIAGL